MKYIVTYRGDYPSTEHTSLRSARAAVRRHLGVSRLTVVGPYRTDAGEGWACYADREAADRDQTGIWCEQIERIDTDIE